MAKSKKKGAAALVRSVAKRARKNPTVEALTADAKTDATGVLLPAGLAFGGSYGASWLAKRLTQPKLGRPQGRLAALVGPHVGPAVSILVLVAAWLVTRKYGRKYRAGVLAGTGIATLLTIAHAYLVRRNVLPAPVLRPGIRPRPVPPEELQPPALPAAEVDGGEQLEGGDQEVDFDEDDLRSFQTGNFRN